MKIELTIDQLGNLHSALHSECSRLKRLYKETLNEKRIKHLKDLVELELYIYSQLFDGRETESYRKHLYSIFIDPLGDNYGPNDILKEIMNKEGRGTV